VRRGMRGLLLALGLTVAGGSSASLLLNGLDLGAAGSAWCRSGLCDTERAEAAARQAERGGRLAEAARLQNEVLRINAASPFAWADAAFLSVASGSRHAALRQAERARLLGPESIPVRMKLFHAYQALGEEQAVREAARAVLGRTRQYDALIFDNLLESGEEMAQLLAVLPTEKPAALGLLQYLAGQRRVAEAEAAWRWMDERRLLSAEGTRLYTHLLLGSGDPEGAGAAWRRFYGAPPANLIVHPDFEAAPDRLPFDWQLTPLAGVQLLPGQGELLVDFEGDYNVNYAHVRQLIVPGGLRRLEFRAEVAGIALSTDEGVGLRLRDAEAPQRFSLETPRLRGTTGWLNQRFDVDLPPGTRLLELAVVRTPSDRIDSHIEGAFRLRKLYLGARP